MHLAIGFSLNRYGVELMYKHQPLIRGRGVSYCKNLLSPRFEHKEGMLSFSCLIRFAKNLLLLELIEFVISVKDMKAKLKRILTKHTMCSFLQSCA